MCRISGIEVLAIIDNNKLKWGSDAAGVPTVAPETLPQLHPDFLVVTSTAFKAIKAQAGALGYPEDNVLEFYANPQQVMQHLGGAYYLYHDTYSLDGDVLISHSHRHTLRGKVTRDIVSPVPFAKQVQLAERLMAAYSRSRRDGADVPPLYRVGENWERELKRTRHELYAAIEQQDAPYLARLLGNFCRNDLSWAILGGEEIFESFLQARHEPWLQHNLDVWMALVDGKAELTEAAMPPIGNPYGYDVDGVTINWNSYVNHGRAHRCARLLEGIDRPVVAEIGGGFGGFAYHLLRRNPKAIYVDFDLPENGLIASYYLSMAYPERRILYYDTPDIRLDRELLSQYDAVMMPNFMLPRMTAGSADLFINTISFSEMEIPTVQEYIAQIDRISRKYFYQENLSCRPPYKGYPSSVFPDLPHFRQLLTSFSSWMGFDSYAPAHSYLDRLYERRN